MRILIRANGETQTLDKPLTIREIERLIGCDTLDSINLPFEEGVHVMCLDDIGAHKDLPVNVAATSFYWGKCGGPVDWHIRGDVVIVPDSDFEPPVRPL